MEPLHKQMQRQKYQNCLQDARCNPVDQSHSRKIRSEFLPTFWQRSYWLPHALREETGITLQVYWLPNRSRGWERTGNYLPPEDLCSVITCLHALHKNAASKSINLWSALYSTVHHSPRAAQSKKRSRWQVRKKYWSPWIIFTKKHIKTGF